MAKLHLYDIIIWYVYFLSWLLLDNNQTSKWLHRWLHRYQCLGSSGIWGGYPRSSSQVSLSWYTMIHTACTLSTIQYLSLTCYAISTYSPSLTWRDVQYLIAYTSNRDSLSNGVWSTNGAGLRVSHKFGFGAIDAEAMVTRAKRWINVPSQHSATVYSSPTSGYAKFHCI